MSTQSLPMTQMHHQQQQYTSTPYMFEEMPVKKLKKQIVHPDCVNKYESYHECTEVCYKEIEEAAQRISVLKTAYQKYIQRLKAAARIQHQPPVADNMSIKPVNQLDKAVSSKLEATMARQIQAQSQTSGKQALQEALKSSLELSVVTTFEQTAPQMPGMFGSSYPTSGESLSQSQLQGENPLSSMGMLNDVSNDKSPFELNDFPQLIGRPSSAGGSQGQLGSLRKQKVGVSSIVQQSQEFSFQNEDFPAFLEFKSGNSDASNNLEEESYEISDIIKQMTSSPLLGIALLCNRFPNVGLSYKVLGCGVCAKEEIWDPGIYTINLDKDLQSGDGVKQDPTTVIWKLIFLRPPTRDRCLQFVLQSIIHPMEEVGMKAICLVANKLFLLSKISQKIEGVATAKLHLVADSDFAMSCMPADGLAPVLQKECDLEVLINAGQQSAVALSHDDGVKEGDKITLQVMWECDLEGRLQVGQIDAVRYSKPKEESMRVWDPGIQVRLSLTLGQGQIQGEGIDTIPHQ